MFLDNIKKIGLIVANILAPKTCLYCKEDQKYDYDSFLCQKCFKNLKKIEFPYCQKCGKELKSGGAFCFNCKNDKKKKYFSFSRSVFEFEPVLREVIHIFKYKGYKKVGFWLGKLMSEELEKYKEYNDFDLILPVPISKRKRSERGFNQSEILAKIISENSNKNILLEYVIKIRDTNSQVGLNKEMREINLKDSFKCVSPFQVKNKRIIIIDDVATTLATLNEVSKVLIESGAKEVAGYTLARE